MTNNAFAQEVLQTELELVRLHQKVAQLQQMKRNEIEVLLEIISTARDRCDRFLERYTGPERRRVAGLKDSFDQIYERVTAPLLEGIEDEVTTVEQASQNDQVEAVPLATQGHQTTDKPHSSNNAAAAETPKESESISPRPILSSATVSEIVTSMQEVQHYGSSQGQEAQTQKEVLAPWPWRSSSAGSKTEHSSIRFESPQGERGEDSFPGSLLGEEESTALVPVSFRDRLLRWYKLRRFVMLEVAIAGIIWISLFFLLAALAPETIRGLVDWITS